MIEVTHGDLLSAPTEALVNAVNTVGVMGKGIALQFRQAFPEMFRAYATACKAGRVCVGKMDVFDRGVAASGPRWIINFPTKRHWREPSRLGDVEAGLVDLVATISNLEIRTIAVPPLGCGLGGLQWEEVRPRIEEALSGLANVKVLIYAPISMPAPMQH